MNEALVKRKVVLDTLERMDKALDTDRTVETYKKLLEECFKVLPTVDAIPRERIEQMIAEIENFPTLNIGEKAFKAVCLTIIQEYTKEQTDGNNNN